MGWAGDDAHVPHVPELLKIAYHALPAQGWGGLGMSTFCPFFVADAGLRC